MADSDVLTAAEFGRLLDRLIVLPAGARLAVAVSGGADSLALCLVAADWARAAGHTLTALTVDHGLRPESGDEAAQVGRWLGARGIPHEILAWTGPKPAADRQAAARRARYRLLLAWCEAHDAAALLTAHHREDQAETLLLRLARGSGVDGLAAMAPRLDVGRVALLRPLLDLPRARLRATLAARGQPWVEDPSNRDDHYARTRMRAAAASLEAAGLGADRLAATAARLARARAALDDATDRLLAAASFCHPAGHAVIATAPVRAAPAEIGLRALRDVLRWVGGDPYPPRLARLEAAFAAWMAGEAVDRTLAGCRLVATGDAVVIAREVRAATPPIVLKPGETAVWDGRFRVKGQAGLPGGAAVGPVGHGADPALKALLRPLPAVARPVVPALFIDGRAVALPTLASDDRVDLTPLWPDAATARHKAYR